MKSVAVIHCWMAAKRATIDIHSHARVKQLYVVYLFYLQKIKGGRCAGENEQEKEMNRRTNRMFIENMNHKRVVCVVVCKWHVACAFEEKRTKNRWQRTNVFTNLFIHTQRLIVTRYHLMYCMCSVLSENTKWQRAADNVNRNPTITCTELYCNCPANTINIAIVAAFAAVTTSCSSVRCVSFSSRSHAPSTAHFHLYKFYWRKRQRAVATASSVTSWPKARKLK